MAVAATAAGSIAAPPAGGDGGATAAVSAPPAKFAAALDTRKTGLPKPGKDSVSNTPAATAKPAAPAADPSPESKNAPAPSPTSPPINDFKVMKTAERAALAAILEATAERVLEAVLGTAPAALPEWVGLAADWVRRIDADYPEARAAIIAAGAAGGLVRQSVIAATLGEQGLADYRRFIAVIGELGDLGMIAVDNAVATIGGRRGLTPEQIADVRLLAGTGVFLATALTGADIHGTPTVKVAVIV